ncbi:hypothetical protein Taro_014149, partial [Colocasia esculenta]|nr:hypothetical protein [Colocasia esculenta]
STTKQRNRVNTTTHNQGRAKQDSRRTSGVKHNAEATPRHTLVETKDLTEHRSNHVRLESHDLSTNIPDLHEVGKEQPSVTTRDTEQPREKHRLTTGTATSDLHQNHPAPRTRHKVRELDTLVPPRTALRNGLPKQQSGVCTRHPERTRRTEATKHGP